MTPWEVRAAIRKRVVAYGILAALLVLAWVALDRAERRWQERADRALADAERASEVVLRLRRQRDSVLTVVDSVEQAASHHADTAQAHHDTVRVYVDRLQRDTTAQDSIKTLVRALDASQQEAASWKRAFELQQEVTAGLRFQERLAWEAVDSLQLALDSTVVVLEARRCEVDLVVTCVSGEAAFVVGGVLGILSR